MRRRVVARFVQDYTSGLLDKEGTDRAVAHLYVPELTTGWGVHLVQSHRLLVRKSQREALAKQIEELESTGVDANKAKETVYRENGLAVKDGETWAKYMAIGPHGEDDGEYEIISLQYIEEGLLEVEDDGWRAAFGDDIALEALATELGREVYVVQAHGSDAGLSDSGVLFFLPHRPRPSLDGDSDANVSQDDPHFLLMKGTGWCGAGADHYEPIFAQERPDGGEAAAVVLD